MSRIYFHAPHRTTEVYGTERAYMGVLASDIALAVLPLRGLDTRESLRPFLRNEAEYMRSETDERRWVQHFETWFRVGWDDGGFEIDGEFVGCTELALNTLIATRSPALCLLAHLHGFCEDHGFCEAEDAAWLADVIRTGRQDNVLRPDVGWDDVAALCDEVAANGNGPIVTSYSVTEGFPNRYVCGDEWFTPGAKGQEENPPDEASEERWYALTDDERWDLAVKAIRAREYNRQLGPAEQDRGFHSGKSAFDLVAARLAAHA